MRFSLLLYPILAVPAFYFSSCPAKNPLCLDSFFNNSSILSAFLGDHGTVIFQDGVLSNNSSCAAMAVLFARGTAEPGVLFLFGITSFQKKLATNFALSTEN
jgi:hypothetical protein